MLNKKIKYKYIKLLLVLWFVGYLLSPKYFSWKVINMANDTPEYYYDIHRITKARVVDNDLNLCFFANYKNNEDLYNISIDIGSINSDNVNDKYEFGNSAKDIGVNELLIDFESVKKGCNLDNMSSRSGWWWRGRTGRA
jgi:hypothetical protein